MYYINMIRDMERRQVLVEPSTSPWVAPVILAKKKDKQFRLCVDYRWLNDVMGSGAYPIPDLNKIIGHMRRGAKMFSVFYVGEGGGYWQMPLHENARTTSLSELVDVHLNFESSPLFSKTVR